MLLCLALLALAYVQRAAPDMPVAFTWLLVALTFPTGLLTGALVGMSMPWVYTQGWWPYSPFLDLLPSWLVMVLTGYLQWFVWLPALHRWIRKDKTPRG